MHAVLNLFLVLRQYKGSTTLHSACYSQNTALRASFCPGDTSPWASGYHCALLCHHLGMVEAMLCHSNFHFWIHCSFWKHTGGSSELASMGPDNWTAVLLCSSRGVKSPMLIIKTMDRKELCSLLHWGIKLPLNILESLCLTKTSDITFIPSSNVTELSAVGFIRNFESERHNAADIMLGTLWNWGKNAILLWPENQFKRAIHEKLTLPWFMVTSIYNTVFAEDWNNPQLKQNTGSYLLNMYLWTGCLYLLQLHP